MNKAQLSLAAILAVVGSAPPPYRASGNRWKHRGHKRGESPFMLELWAIERGTVERRDRKQDISRKGSRRPWRAIPGLTGKAYKRASKKAKKVGLARELAEVF